MTVGWTPPGGGGGGAGTLGPGGGGGEGTTGGGGGGGETGGVGGAGTVTFCAQVGKFHYVNVVDSRVSDVLHAELAELGLSGS